MVNLNTPNPLLVLIGILLTGFFRFSVLVSYDERLKKAENDERSALLGTPGVPQHPPLNIGRKLVASVAALSYGAMTIFLSWAAIAEYGASILKDSTFTFGRVGMVVASIAVLIRLVSHREGSSLRELQAEAWVLVMIPAFVYLLGTPIAHFPENKSVVAQALGAICFFTVRGSLINDIKC